MKQGNIHNICTIIQYWRVNKTLPFQDLNPSSEVGCLELLFVFEWEIAFDRRIYEFAYHILLTFLVECLHTSIISRVRAIKRIQSCGSYTFQTFSPSTLLLLIISSRQQNFKFMRIQN